uniref:GcrA family cell cycle regulator n=1 Tax=Candidatus Pelagibacter sp. HIMB1517 TaxID=3413341 RepID=UPI003F8505AF
MSKQKYKGVFKRGNYLDWGKPENIEKLKTLFHQGKTHQQIATEFGVNRVTISGRLQRLNLYRLREPMSEQELIERKKKEKNWKKHTPISELSPEEQKVRRSQFSYHQKRRTNSIIVDFKNGYRERFWKYKINKIKVNIKQRKSTRDTKVEISWEELESIYIKQRGLCFYSGIELIPFVGKKTKESRYTQLSVDRIDNAKGYIPGNVRLVTERINSMRGNLTEDEFIKICKMVNDKSK